MKTKGNNDDDDDDDDEEEEEEDDEEEEEEQEERAEKEVVVTGEIGKKQRKERRPSVRPRHLWRGLNPQQKGSGRSQCELASHCATDALMFADLEAAPLNHSATNDLGL
ncbi:hypothetical protein PoB_005885000 [Plakobranchus ocellatus]|uniref:Uncharacterized protein n=1 Tax=Plakobranchus ocellatus TaxID=259542 RepID=A0AAV4CKG3_9GAST|nr:hypothetical protein PoB_005885000 [Plakobranchus ocellatus]